MPTVKTMRDGTIKLIDATPTTPHEITIPFSVGDLTFTIKNNIINIMDRGTLNHMRAGDEEPITGSFSVKLAEFYSQTSATSPTMYEALFKLGDAAGWVSVVPCSIYAVKCELSYASPCDDEDGEKITFNKFIATDVNFKEANDGNTLSVTFTDYETKPTITKL